MLRGLSFAFRVILLLVAILILVLFASFILKREEELPVVTVQTTVLNPAPALLNVEGADLLLRDDFNGTQGAWVLSEPDQALYQSGMMVLNDRHYDGFGWARPHLQFENFVLDTQARWIGGALGGIYGIFFGYLDENNYYAFTVSNDGWYRISHVQNGVAQVLDENLNIAVHPGGEINRFRLEVNNQNLRFFINEAYLVDIADTSWQRGDIMLVAQKAGESDNYLVAFDDITVHLYPIP